MTDAFRVLYVDDEPDLLEIGKLFLEQSGDIAVTTAQSAPDAIRLLELERFDAIVSDYQMPGMDGIQFLVEVRSHFGRVPFILFTGKGREEVVIQAINSGADFYLQKGGDSDAQFAELSNKIRYAVMRMTAEKALSESQKRAAEIIEFLPDATFAISTDGVVIAWNHAMEVMTGVVKDKVLNKGDYEYSFPFYRERRPILIDLVLDPDEVTAGMYPSIQKEGDRIISEISIPHFHEGRGAYLWFTASPLYDSEGNISGAIESIRDITDLKRAEVELRESEVRYRHVVEGQTEFICRFLPDRTYVFVNEAYCRYFGLNQEEIIGTRFQPEIHPDDRGPVARLIASLSPEHPLGTIDQRTIMPDGSTRWQRWVDRAFFHPDGQLKEYQSVGRDITRTKHDEEALRESEELFRGLFDSANEAIFLHELLPDGKPGRYTKVNTIACQRLGYTPDELFGMSPLDIVSFESLSKIPQIAMMVQQEGHGTFDTIHRRKDGSEFPVEISTRILEMHGKKMGLSIARDITERKRAEEALNRANRKITLLSGITRHDILNQLTVLTGQLELLERKQPDPSFSTYFNKISCATEGIQAMIRFTKEYESIGVHAPCWQDCRTLVDTAAKNAPPGKVMVRNDLPVGTEVFADQLITRVFYNLVDNTIRYGGKTTTIRFSALERDGVEVLVCEDDGVGIPAEEKEMIFERGFGKNTGMGLFLSREILSITGITITETGEPGKGARFEIAVPKGMWRSTGDDT